MPDQCVLLRVVREGRLEKEWRTANAVGAPQTQAYSKQHVVWHRGSQHLASPLMSVFLAYPFPHTHMVAVKVSACIPQPQVRLQWSSRQSGKLVLTAPWWLVDPSWRPGKAGVLLVLRTKYSSVVVHRASSRSRDLEELTFGLGVPESTSQQGIWNAG